MTCRAGLSSRWPWYESWRSRLSSVHVRYVTPTTRSGFTQCTLPSFNGEPNRLSRGGGAASGIFATASELQNIRQSLQLLVVDAGAGAARVEQAAIVGVVAE